MYPGGQTSKWTFTEYPLWVRPCVDQSRLSSHLRLKATLGEGIVSTLQRRKSKLRELK